MSNDIRDLARLAPESLTQKYRVLWKVLYEEELPRWAAKYRVNGRAARKRQEAVRETVLTYLAAGAPVTMAEEAARAELTNP